MYQMKNPFEVTPTPAPTPDQPTGVDTARIQSQIAAQRAGGAQAFAVNSNGSAVNFNSDEEALAYMRKLKPNPVTLASMKEAHRHKKAMKRAGSKNNKKK